MPISAAGGNATQSNPYQALAATTGAGTPPTAAAPGLALPSVATSPVDPNSLQMNNQQVLQLLSNAPQSLTSVIGPLLQQVFGMNQNLMKPIFDQQGAQGAAQAQSDAARRGLTGSSIEGANMGAARASANSGYDQYLAQMLQQLVPQYTQAAQFDIGQNTGYYSNLAQAVGQGTAAAESKAEFERMFSEGMAQAAANRNAGAQQAVIGGLFNMGSSAIGKWCDIRLKESVHKIGDWRGLGIYAYKYRRDTDLDLPHGVQIGVLAHEVARKHSDALLVEKGYLKVNYKKLWEIA